MLVSSNFFCSIKKLYFIQVNQVELHNSCQKHWSTNSLEEFSFCSASVFQFTETEILGLYLVSKALGFFLQQQK
jgi:hypothetical protein